MPRQRNSGRRCAAVFVAIVWGAALADAQTLADLKGRTFDASGAITGIVRSATDVPLAGVTVRVRGAAERVATTGPDGRFELAELPEGEYDLDAVLEGFGPVRRTLRIAPGQRATVSLTLLVHLRDEVVVTATKTGEVGVQTTPMAITVLPGVDLARMEARTVAQRRFAT